MIDSHSTARLLMRAVVTEDHLFYILNEKTSRDSEARGGGDIVTMPVCSQPAQYILTWPGPLGLQAHFNGNSNERRQRAGWLATRQHLTLCCPGQTWRLFV